MKYSVTEGAPSDILQNDGQVFAHSNLQQSHIWNHTQPIEEKKIETKVSQLH
jgi:hypothetical protein